MRDRALNVLARRLPAFQRVDVQYGRTRAAAVPLGIAAAIGAFTWLAVGAAQELRAGATPVIRGSGHAQKQLFVGIVSTLGPVGTAVLGGILVLACAAWLVARVRKPPLMATISPRG